MVKMLVSLVKILSVLMDLKSEVKLDGEEIS